jgi:hypothetical protein
MTAPVRPLPSAPALLSGATVRVRIPGPLSTETVRTGTVRPSFLSPGALYLSGGGEILPTPAGFLFRFNGVSRPAGVEVLSG